MDDQNQSTDRKFLMFCGEHGDRKLGVIVIADTDPVQVVDVVTADTQDELNVEFQKWLIEPRLPKSALS